MRQIALFFAAAFITGAALFGAWLASLGYYNTAEHWVGDAYRFKRQVALNTTGPRILLLAGSSALVGIDSENLSKLTGKPVVNLATFGGLPLEFHVATAEELAKPGDIVVMPLEFNYYAERPTLSLTNVANLESWGAWFILDHPKRWYRYFRHTSFATSARRLWERRPLPTRAVELVAEKAAKNTRRGMVELGDYTANSLNSFGDMLFQGRSNIKVIAGLPSFSVSGHAMDQLIALDKSLKKKGATLWLTWPAWVPWEVFDIRRDFDRSKVEQVREQVAKRGLTIHCDPEKFQFGMESMLDMPFHLNVYGAQLRTAQLAECLGVAVPAGTGERLYRDRVMQAEAYDKENPSDEIVLVADLTTLAAALDRYHTEKGSFPIANSWFGLHSAFGESRPDWVPGLAPEYIPALPRDPRMHDEPTEQYLYRSDGRDYKLVSHRPARCEIIRRMKPVLIDPVRGCNAVGYWTKGAADW